MANSTDKTVLAAAILAAASTQAGTWNGPHGGPSLTVTSECVIALCEYVAQLPIVSGSEELTRKIYIALSDAKAFIVSEFNSRAQSSANPLDGPNSILSLAAYLSISAMEANGAAAPAGGLDEAFVGLALSTAAEKFAERTLQPGEIWASMKGMETILGILETYPAMTDSFSAMVGTSTKLNTAKDNLSTRILGILPSASGPAAPYDAAIIFDLIKNAPQWAKKDAQIEKLEMAELVAVTSLADVVAQEGLGLTRISRLSLADPKRARSDRRYEVPVFSALVTGIDKMLSDRAFEGDDDRWRAALYRVGNEMLRDAEKRNSEPFVLAHALRSLSQVDLNSRELRYIDQREQIHNRDTLNLLRNMQNRDQEIINTPITIGTPGNRLFISSNYFTWSLFLLFLLTTLLYCLIKLSNDIFGQIMIVSSTVILLAPIHFGAFKALHHWEDLDNRKRASALLLFTFSYYFVLLLYTSKFLLDLIKMIKD